MKKYKVEAIMKFTDKEENEKRNVGDKFEVIKERYEYLRAKSAVKLIEIVEKEEEPVNEVVNEEESYDLLTKKPKRRKASKK